MTERRDLVLRARTLLFVPGARPDRFDRALGTAADMVIVDLEASVRPVDKAAARRSLLDWLPRCPAPERLLIRVNTYRSEWFTDDLEVFRSVRTAGMVLPMAESVADVAAAIAAAPPDLAAIALIETAAGVLDARGIASVPNVVRLAFGNMDYATNTGTRGRESAVFPCAQLVLASKVAGLPPPIAGVTAAFRDARLLAEEASWERDQGFGGKFCIHPEQIDRVQQIFSPSPEELAWAKRVLEAAGDSFACEVDGEMVDRPVVERARRIVDDA